MLKVFTDEPLALDAPADEPVPRGAPREMASLESLLRRPTYARAYLAGTHLGDETRTGLTALADPSLWREPLSDLWAGFEWSTHPEGLGPSRSLLSPAPGVALAAAPEAVDPALLARVGQAEDRAGWSALRAILDQQPSALVFTPEPAHDGWDWVVYTGQPLRQRLLAALQAHEAPGARRLVMPYQKARGEHKFYLERWALDDLPEWAMEV